MGTKKRSRPPSISRPFENLQALLKSKSVKLVPSPAKKSAKSGSKTTPKASKHHKTTDPTTDQPAPENEKELFMEAMADVSPIPQDDRIVHDPVIRPPKGLEHDCEDDTLQQLNKLIKSGEGFVVADTPEYIEGTGYNVNPEIAKRLHRGDFSIQAHLDLHGMGVEDARDALERFLKDTILTGKRAVLLVHGRGLSSPAKPVLKTKVIEWLTCGPWRKWVIAFTSARSFDGGAGATYVLLRQRPVTRSQRKRKKPL